MSGQLVPTTPRLDESERGDRPTTAPGPEGQGRVPALVSVVIVLVALASLPFQTGLPALATIELVDGTAEVRTAGAWEQVELGRALGVGSRVRATGDGATFAAAGGRVELRTGAVAELAGPRRLALERGSVLLDVDALWQVEVGAAAVRGSGLVRVDVGSVRRAAVYRGGASVTVDGAGTPVPALDQVDLADLDLLEAVPLGYDADDAWDARYLAAAIDVDRDVAALERALTAQYGQELQAPEFYGDFLAVDDVLATALPDLAPREAGERFGPPAPTLTAVVVARTLVTGARLSQGEAVAEIRRERAAGATWGLLLTDHELGPRALAAATEDALRRRALAVSEGEAAPVRRPPGPPADEAGGGAAPPEGAGDPSGDGRARPADPGPGPGTDPGGGPDPEPEPEPSPEPTPVPIPEPVDEIVDEAVGDVADTVDELLGTLPLPGGGVPDDPPIPELP